MKYLILVLLSGLASTAYADYACKGEITEVVLVMEITYKIVAGNKGVDYSKGVPEELIVAKRMINAHLFDGDFTKLQYSRTGSTDDKGNGEGILSYRFRAKTPVDLQIVTACRPEVSDRCVYWVGSDGHEPGWAAMPFARSQDRSIPGNLTATMTAQVDKDELVVGLSILKTTHPARLVVNNRSAGSYIRVADGAPKFGTSVTAGVYNDELAIGFEARCVQAATK